MRQSTLVPYAILVLGALAAALFVPHFRSSFNLGNVLVQSVPLLLVAAGQTIVLITAGIDMSIGATVTLATIVASYIMGQSAGSIVLAVVAALGAGVLVGLLNGLGVSRLGLQPFLVTLAAMFALQGFNLYLRPVPGGFVPEAFRTISSVRWGLVPVAAAASLVLIALVAIHIRRSRFGLNLYAIGGNAKRALLAGVPVNSVLLRAYILSGLSAALAGLFLAARTGTGSSDIGDPYAFDSITAAILGGASLFGARGSLWGAIAGALFLAIVSNALNLLGVTAYWQWIVSGGLLILFVSVYGWWEVKQRGKHPAVRQDQTAPAGDD